MNTPNQAGRVRAEPAPKRVRAFLAGRKVAGLACFYDEKVDLYIDGLLQDRPHTPFS